MSAKVFKIHKRDKIPGEAETLYSIEDFSKKENKYLEKCQFFLQNGSEVFDINEAVFFEIKRQTLKTDN